MVNYQKEEAAFGYTFAAHHNNYQKDTPVVLSGELRLVVLNSEMELGLVAWFDSNDYGNYGALGFLKATSSERITKSHTVSGTVHTYTFKASSDDSYCNVNFTYDTSTKTVVTKSVGSHNSNYPAYITYYY